MGEIQPVLGYKADCWGFLGILGGLGSKSESIGSQKEEEEEERRGQGKSMPLYTGQHPHPCGCSKVRSKKVT